MSASRSRRGVLHWKFVLITGLAALLVCAAAGFYVLNFRPGLAAQAADGLRAIFGDEAVAQLESTVYQAQDNILRWEYRWFKTATSKNAAFSPAVNLPSQAVTSGSSQPTQTPSLQITVNFPTSSETEASTHSISPTFTLTPTAEPVWQLENLPAISGNPDEGQWGPLIRSPEGKTLAFQTYLEPDGERPFAQVRVVAFDMRSVRLHYMVGRDEPVSEVKMDRPGTIPAEDRLPGVLLAVFNGGFKGRHGHFGVMVDGTILLPPKDQMGTLALYEDGHLLLGEWGTEIEPEAGQVAWRQNGPLVVRDGQVNPLVNDRNPALWGYTIQEMAPIWRSAIGLSEDGQILYYFAGPSLTLPALASAISASGAANAIQLDINNYWVHFDSIYTSDGKLKTQPLFEFMGRDFCDRYLYPYTRDFFYVTVNSHI